MIDPVKCIRHGRVVCNCVHHQLRPRLRLVLLVGNECVQGIDSGSPEKVPGRKRVTFHFASASLVKLKLCPIKPFLDR